MLAGLGCLGWVGYQYLGTHVVSERAFDAGRQDLRQRWEQSPPEPEPPETGVSGSSGTATVVVWRYWV